MAALDDLKTGIHFTTIKGDVRQPHNYAMGRVPSRYSRWCTASIYALDVDRVLQELNTSLSFVSAPPEEAFLSQHSTTLEDYIMYHQGYFLDLVHQLKDKLCQLTKAIVTYENEYTGKHEKAAELARLLKDENVQKIPLLYRSLKEWDADDCAQQGPISIVLKKRTFYHHFKNPLPNTDSYFKAKSHRYLLGPSFEAHLSDYGKQMLVQRGEQSLKLWQTDTTQKMSATLATIGTNVENISRSLIDYYRLPHTADQFGRVVRQYTHLDQLLDISDSSYRIEKIDPAIRGMIEGLAKALPLILEDEFVALYVTGSVPRGCFQWGLSNVNFTVIIKSDSSQMKSLIRQFIEGPALRYKIPIDTKVLSKSEFASEEYAKERFVCRTDGLLLAGAYLLTKERGQRICFRLAWMLNRDFGAHLTSLKSTLENTSRIISERELTLMTRELAKRTLRLSFSQVIGNHVRYSPHFPEMKRLNDFYYPDNAGFNNYTYQLATKHPLTSRSVLLSVCKSIEEKMMPLYSAIDGVVNGVP